MAFCSAMAKELIKLESEEPGALARLAPAITNVVAASFKQDKSRQTGAEENRRIEICIGFIREMRHDVGWSTQRIIDEMGKYLRCKLDRIPYVLPTRTLWSPPEPGKLIIPGR